MKNRAVLEVDLNLLKQNCLTLKSLAKNLFFCPMVKADAYGHGAIPVTKTLLSIGVKQVGVISVGEAWAVRELVEDIDILIFGPVLNKEDLSWAVEEKLILVCSNWLDLESLSQYGKPCRIHLKFNTGFSRLGFDLSSVEKLDIFLKDNPQIQLEGLATQLVSGEELGDKESFSFCQTEELSKLHKVFSCSNFHALNTSALIADFVHGGNVHFGARPGIGLYGIKPEVFLKNEKAKPKWENLFLAPVSCLKSYIVGMHELNKGDPVSYGACWKASRPSQIATVSLGYGDGFLRNSNSIREVLFRGKRSPVVGAVCMDFFMIDVTDFANKREKPVQIGEEVVIFGRQGQTFLCPQDQAFKSGSIVYEFFCRLGPRVERVYKN